MNNEGAINVSVDGEGDPVVYSPYEETAKREDIIALYTKALELMETLFKGAMESGEVRRQVPSMHFDSSQCKPFSIPFKIISDGRTGTAFEVEFIDKDYTVLNLAFGQLFLKEKRKQVRRKPKTK